MNDFTPQSWVDSHNGRDLNAFLSWFAPDGEVEDEGAVHRGADIARWVQGTWKAYDTRWTLLEAPPQKTVLRMEVRGNFPGSPLTFVAHLVLNEGRIRRLSLDTE